MIPPCGEAAVLANRQPAAPKTQAYTTNDADRFPEPKN
jgi:hypothetical protein